MRNARAYTPYSPLTTRLDYPDRLALKLKLWAQYGLPCMEELKKMAEEQVFLEEGGVSVTNARFIVPGQTYTMSGVTSVSSLKQDPSRKGPIALIIIGIIFLLSGFGEPGAGALVLGIILIIGGIFWLKRKKDMYVVVLRSASGESEALRSTDSNFIFRVIEKLNDAIVAQG